MRFMLQQLLFDIYTTSSLLGAFFIASLILQLDFASAQRRLCFLKLAFSARQTTDEDLALADLFPTARLSVD